MISARNLAPLLIAAVATTAFADDYRAQVRVTADHQDADEPSLIDLDFYTATGTYYFKPVVTDGLPLAEADFLTRASFANLAVSHFEPDQGLGDANAFGANVGYYVPNTIFFGRVGVSRIDFDGGGYDTRVYGAVGVTPIDGLLLTSDLDEDGWDPNISAKYVGKMGNGHFYAATVRAVDPDQGDITVGIDFDYFIDLTFKVGAGYAEGGDRFSVRAEKFITPRFAVGGAAFTDDVGKGFGAQVSWRF